jgi:transcription elongation factor
LKIINDQGEIKNIKITEINKKFERDRKANTIDSQRNTLYPDNVVKLIGGKYKSRKGVIKYIYKNILFLWDREFIQSNGIFVENTSNSLILGDEHMKQNEAGPVASMNRRIKDSIVGKEVLIIKGEWKGYRGRVCRADDK